MLTVYHRINTRFVLENPRTDGGVDKKDFAAVAEISSFNDTSTDTLNTAYVLTNTINNYWWENEGVNKLFDGPGCRSTSVGDVIDIDGTPFEVASFGFQECAWVSSDVRA